MSSGIVNNPWQQIGAPQPVPLTETDTAPLAPQLSAAEVAATRSLVSRDGTEGTLKRRQFRTLARCLTGRSRALALTDGSFPVNSNANGLTIRARVALAGEFDAVRVHVPNMHTSTVAGFRLALGVTATLGAWNTTAPTLNNTGADTAAAPTNTESVNASGGVLLTATFARQSSVTLPVAENATALCPSWSTTDWMPIKSLARSDGGTFPLLDVVGFYPAGTTATQAYTGASGTAWAMWGRDDTPSNGRVWRAWMQDGDCITTPGNFTETTTTPSLWPILIEYRSKKRGYTVLVAGDSIYNAHNVTYPQDGFAHKALSTLHSADAPVELCDISVPGATTMAILERAQIIVPLLKPAVIVAQSSSVNNYGASLGARVQQHGEGTVGGFCALAAENNAGLVIGSMFPVTNAAKGWGATDSQRVTLNTNLGARDDDFVWLDWGPTVDGAAGTGGQIEPAAALIQGDGIHFDDEGHTAMVTPFVAAVNQALANYGTP